MNLIFIHGPPAAGKLTVAQEIVKKIEGRLFDNHAAIDFAKTIFDFGTPEFWRLVRSARLMAIEQAAESKLETLVCTACYSEPEDRPYFEKLTSIVESKNGKMMPVYLNCDKRTLLLRVGNEDRAERKKLTSSEGLEEFLTSWKIAAVNHPACHQIDSGRKSAEETAEEIIEQFKLVRVK